MAIDTSPRIAQIPILSLSGVDCLLGKGLRYVFSLILPFMYTVFQSGVDLAAKTRLG
ncbi:MAG: hypothetical protein HWQ38_08620 [Nostoc sp. NMS7]|uniref:hypothetical protein n=1 Tax=Nostoc sp. NMS7 TaxID=2815391 RepID=UPI0025ECA5E7|nr:hypothetical protein [Nostoc sp. NMS7]MBN3946545.1 hypothetical protein [Nostoc sp. NMS7]